MNSPRILVIDKEENVEAMIRDGLLYYPVEMAFSTGKYDAITQISKQQPDLIISGLNFKDGNAVDLILELKQIVPAVPPGIFIAEDPKLESHLEMQGKILKLGVVDLLHRPFEMNMLHQKIDHAVYMLETYKAKTRIERFIDAGNKDAEFQELLEESRKMGIPVAQLIELKQVSNK